MLLNLLLTLTLTPLALSTPLLQPRQDDTGCMFFKDLVNECQKQYGGSWNICESSCHQFEIPNCSGGLTGKKMTCEYFQSPCPKDKQKPGESVYGGCYGEDDPVPLWAAPECLP